MANMSKPVAKPDLAVETEREGPVYHKTLVRSGYAPVNGFQMYYEIHGAVTTRPLVTIHPWLGSADVFPSLIRNRQLIAVALQGHGRTADVDRPMTFEQHADDIAGLLKYLRIKPADFFGESFGGTVAMQMAIRHPEMVRRVAIYGSILSRLEEVVPLESMAEFMKLTPDHRSIQVEREAYERVAPDPSQWPTLFAKACRAAGGWKGFSHDELKSIKAPVLIMAGDHDNLVPPVDYHLEMSRLIPNARLAVIPDTGHFVLYEEPEKVLPIVAAFLDLPTSTVPFATTTSGYHPGETR